MQIVYAQQAYPTTVTKTLFLAGPTPRREAESWRTDALGILRELGFDGHVFIPEPIDGEWAEDYADQVEWERGALERADVIAFWVPRDVTGQSPDGNGSPMPALTTNDEWGTWKASGKVVWGSPGWADSTRYQKYYAKSLGVPQAASLRETLELALTRLGDGAEREGGSALVPLYVWIRRDFQAWYGPQIAVGNELREFRVAWSVWVGPKKDRLVVYAIEPTVWIKSEDRVKRPPECIVIRSDISSICLYQRPGGSVAETRVVLVQEYRVAARNERAMVLELPGGSSAKADANPLQTAAEEVSEEVGLSLETNRLRSHGSRQMGATLAGYHAHLFSAELTAEEMTKLATDDTIHGADSDERITLQVKTLREILGARLVDWPMLGMIFEAVVSSSHSTQ